MEFQSCQHYRDVTYSTHSLTNDFIRLRNVQAIVQQNYVVQAKVHFVKQNNITASRL